MLTNKREILFTILAGIFITNAVAGELIGGKLIQLGPFTMSIGIIPWPVVFLTTDLINEYYGKKGVRRLTLLTSLLIVYTFILLFSQGWLDSVFKVLLNLPAPVGSPPDFYILAIYAYAYGYKTVQCKQTGPA